MPMIRSDAVLIYFICAVVLCLSIGGCNNGRDAVPAFHVTAEDVNGVTKVSRPDDVEKSLMKYISTNSLGSLGTPIFKWKDPDPEERPWNELRMWIDDYFQFAPSAAEFRAECLTFHCHNSIEERPIKLLRAIGAVKAVDLTVDNCGVDLSGLAECPEVRYLSVVGWITHLTPDELVGKFPGLEALQIYSFSKGHDVLYLAWPPIQMCKFDKLRNLRILDLSGMPPIINFDAMIDDVLSHPTIEKFTFATRVELDGMKYRWNSPSSPIKRKPATAREIDLDAMPELTSVKTDAYGNILRAKFCNSNQVLTCVRHIPPDCPRVELEGLISLDLRGEETHIREIKWKCDSFSMKTYDCINLASLSNLECVEFELASDSVQKVDIFELLPSLNIKELVFHSKNIIPVGLFKLPDAGIEDFEAEFEVVRPIAKKDSKE